MATENIMMQETENGGSRQGLHEKLREHSMAAAKVVKQEGGENDLIQRVANDPDFTVTAEEITAVLKPENYIGRCPQQVDGFLKECIDPILEKNRELLGEKAELSV